MELLITVTQLRTHILTLTRMDTIRRMLTAMVIRRSGLGLATAATTAVAIMAAIVAATAGTVVLRAASAVAEQFAVAAVFVVAADAAND